MNWTEVEAHGEKIRYRVRSGEFARESSRYDLQYWHPTRHEWRDVENWSSRDWFVLGVEAGRDMSEAVQHTLNLGAA